MLLEEKELTLRQRLKLQSELYAAVRKLDLVEELLQMPGVNEIMINGYDQIYIEENGQLRRWKKSFVRLPGRSMRWQFRTGLLLCIWRLWQQASERVMR